MCICITVSLQAEEFASDQPYNSESVAKETVQTELDQLGMTLKQAGVSWGCGACVLEAMSSAAHFHAYVRME